MKKIIVIAIALLVFQNWDSLTNYFGPSPDYDAEYDGEVILYSTAWCGYCAKTRELLEDNNIGYYEYDIEKSAEGREQFYDLGGSGVPMLLINGQVVNGYNPARILALAK